MRPETDAPDSTEELLPPTSPFRRGRARWLVGGVVLAVALTGLGWRLAEHGDHSARATPSSTSAVASSMPTTVAEPVGDLADNGNRCSGQNGRQLTLGIQVTNGRSEPIRVESLDVQLPLGALRQISVHQSRCVATSEPLTPFVLESGGRAWLSAVFDVVTACPSFAPVLFSVHYTGRDRGVDHQTPASGFPDLGGVEFSGCGP